MLLAFTICHLIVLTIANPFHKYPFVFLLDVGNEELEKTNTEQLRISAPGGSVAIRYPAVGDGDTIAHVRVSGIDFGTDLKANIVDGGPGYKYVVLVFMGNRGVPYDAVVTIQTVPSENGVSFNIDKNIISDNVNSNEESDPNDSAEDLSDDSDEANGSSREVYAGKISAESMQSSANVYSYAQNEVMDSSEDGDESDSDGVKDIHNEYSGTYSKDQQFKDYIESDQEDSQINNTPEAGKYSSDDDDTLYDDKESDGNDGQSKSFDDDSSDKYESVKSYIEDGGIKEYSQEESVRPVSNSEYVDYVDSEELDQMFNDEEVHNEAENYRDPNNNNNYVDSDGNAAVAY